MLSTMLLAFAGATSHAQPVLLEVHTSNGTDTSYYGIELDIIFHLDATNADSIFAIFIPLELRFSNGNILGPLAWGPQFDYFPAAETLTWRNFRHFGPTDPDSVLIVAFGAEGPDWMGAANLCHIFVQPLDTGHIMFGSIFIPPDNTLRAFRDNGVGGGAGELAVGFNAPTIVVEPCPSDLMGDVDASADITSADVIYLVNYTFKSGPEPIPSRLAGDADCSRTITSADIIRLVNFTFKSGAAPCPCSNAGL